MSGVIAEHRVKMVMAASDIVAKLDESIRADAFRFLLREGAPASESASSVDSQPAGHLTPSAPDLADFFKDRRGGNPAANAVLIAGYLYTLYGDAPFTVDEIRSLAKQVGLVVPARLDMTFLTAQRDNRNLFTRAGTGRFRPTVNGELYFQREGVTKGSFHRPADDEMAGD